MNKYRVELHDSSDSSNFIVTIDAFTAEDAITIAKLRHFNRYNSKSEQTVSIVNMECQEEKIDEENKMFTSFNNRIDNLSKVVDHWRESSVIRMDNIEKEIERLKFRDEIMGNRKIGNTQAEETKHEISKGDIDPIGYSSSILYGNERYRRGIEYGKRWAWERFCKMCFTCLSV